MFVRLQALAAAPIALGNSELTKKAFRYWKVAERLLKPDAFAHLVQAV
jgi:hypothetical protein